MKFLETSKETQVVLMGSALAGVIEAFSRDEADEGRQLLETALKQIGLTPDEFKDLMTELPLDVERDVLALHTESEQEDDEDIDADYAHLPDEDLRKLSSEIKPEEDFTLWDRGSMIALIERDFKEREEDNPYRVDNSNVNEDGWENLEDEQ